jgi:CBS domain-containing protein
MVSEHCTRDVVVAEPGESLVDVARRMRDEHVGAIVVVDKLDSRRPVGMLTDRDIVVGPVAQAVEKLGTLTVGDVMTAPALSAYEADALDSALTKMERAGVRRLAVVDGSGAVSGVLAVDDVIGHVTGELGKLVSLLAHESEREQERRR